jgi:hypothetical protein
MRPTLKNMTQTALIAVAVALLLYIASLLFGADRMPSSALPQAQNTPKTEEVFAGTVAPMLEYIKIIDSCGPYFESPCVNVRSGPGVEYPIVSHLRTGLVLKTSGSVEQDGRIWHKIAFDDWVWYPERVTSDWFVSSDFADSFYDDGEIILKENSGAEISSKRIIVDRSMQMLYAYDGDDLFMEEPISTGLEFTPTPRGIFKVYKKTPSRYMQGPLPGISDQYYDLPGVPWNLYFTEQGGVIHGAYWHDKFGQPWSHGCVNLTPEKAEELYRWADIGTRVVVRD